MKPSILGLRQEELKEAIVALGEPAYRVSQVYEWVFRHGAQDFTQMTNLSKGLREKLSEHFELKPAGPISFVSTDGTEKFQFRLHDGVSIESVWIPEDRRKTLCISSQVGCPLKCAFCVTGAVGYKRNLTPAEIVAQVWHVKVVRKLPITNIVFMGMGEPLLNAEAVIQAIHVISEPTGIGIGKRKITVSTAGIVPNIATFLEAVDVKLAISLTGSSDKSRDYWMPINKKYDLATLKAALRKVHIPEGRKITFEVVLMAKKNDTKEEAEDLSQFLKGLPAKVNLIPYNENPYFPDLHKPDPEAIETFQKVLFSHGIRSMVRKNRGQDVMAACGQLAGKDLTGDRRP